MKLISWNVNGLRACLTHGFAESFAAAGCRYLFGAGDQDAARSGGFCAGWLHRVYLFCREEGLLRHGLLVP